MSGHIRIGEAGFGGFDSAGADVRVHFEAVFAGGHHPALAFGVVAGQRGNQRLLFGVGREVLQVFGLELEVGLIEAARAQLSARLFADLSEQQTTERVRHTTHTQCHTRRVVMNQLNTRA
jgi:hypothetical protein